MEGDYRKIRKIAILIFCILDTDYSNALTYNDVVGLVVSRQVIQGV